MNRRQAAQEVLRVAKDLSAMDFPTKDALEKYLHDHPGADKSRHVVTDKREQKRRDYIKQKREKEKAQRKEKEKQTGFKIPLHVRHHPSLVKERAERDRLGY